MNCVVTYIATVKYYRRDSFVKKGKIFKLTVLRAQSKHHGAGSSEGLKIDGRIYTGKNISSLHKEIKKGWDSTIPPKGPYL